MSRFVLAGVLVACSATPSTPTTSPPVKPPPDAPASPSAPTLTSVGCYVLPQPAKPGHATVEPDDMICMHGDTPYRCPAGFDATAFHCEHPTKYPAWAGTTGVPWCCRSE